MDYSTQLKFSKLHTKIYQEVRATMVSTARKPKEKWEAFYLFEFSKEICPEEKEEDEKKILNDIFVRRGFDSGFAHLQKRTREGFTMRNSDAIFNILAEFQNIPLLVCFLNFLEFCQDNSLPLSVFGDKGTFSGTLNNQKISITLEELIDDIKKHIDSQTRETDENITESVIDIERQEEPTKSAGNPEDERKFIIEILGGEPTRYIGDAIEIETITDSQIVAKLRYRYAEKIDEFKGKFSLNSCKETWNHWCQDYQLARDSQEDDDLIEFIKNNIETQSREDVIEAAKIGFVAYNSDIDAITNKMSFDIRPVNHLMVMAFNRKLATERLKNNNKSLVHDIWERCLSRAFEPIQAVELPCPSQLFVELALITSDNKYPITFKKDQNSVYALRNNEKKLKTCGIERGPNWKDVIQNTKDSDVVTIRLLPGILKGLEREFRLNEMPDWESRKEDIQVRMKTFVLQALHLNTAILGYCKVPYTSNELLQKLKGSEAGGLDHSELKFQHIDTCKEMVEKYDRSTEWHGTAIMRLQIVMEDKTKIDTGDEKFN